MGRLEDITRADVAEVGRLAEIFKTAKMLGDEGTSAVQQGDMDRGRNLYLNAALAARKTIPTNDHSAQQYGGLLADFYIDRMGETPKESRHLND